jgi:hypothetical protein
MLAGKMGQVEVVSGTLIMRWVNVQLSRLSDWVDRTIEQERWQPISMQQRYGESIVEVFRIIEEVDSYVLESVNGSSCLLCHMC